MTYIPHLRVFEDEIYKGVYCGLCRQIKKQFGGLSRFSLSYDMVFLSLFLICYYEEKMSFEKKICAFHPLKRRFFLKRCGALEKAADIGVILSYFKIKDNVLDETKFKKFFSVLLLKIFKRPYKKAKSSQKDIDLFVEDLIKRQIETEKEMAKSYDFYSHPTAKCLGLIFKQMAKQQTQEDFLYRIGYMLGKYIYLMDALDDLVKDVRKKNFNPILASNVDFSKDRYEKEKAFVSLKEVLNFSIAQLAESFENLKVKNGDMLRNIIYLGLKKEKDKIFKKTVKSLNL